MRMRMVDRGRELPSTTRAPGDYQSITSRRRAQGRAGQAKEGQMTGKEDRDGGRWLLWLQRRGRERRGYARW
jgi:hypothetical protein